MSSILTEVSNTIFLFFLGVKNLSKHAHPTNSTQKRFYNFYILVAPHNLDALQLSFSSQSPSYSLMLFFNAVQYFSCFWLLAKLLFSCFPMFFTP